MSVALRLKRARLAKGWSQKHLAATLGVTSSFITKIEAGDAYPSYERGLLMAQALDLPWDELWSAIEAERDAASRQRRQQRGAALQAMVTRGPTPRAAGGPAAPTPAVVPPPPPDAARIAAALAADPDLHAAYEHLQTALANPQMRPIALQTLAAMAQTVQTKP